MKNEKELYYVINADANCFVCKGSYVYQGEPYKVIGDLKDARKFKNKTSAENELERLLRKYQNIDHNCRVVCIEE